MSLCSLYEGKVDELAGLMNSNQQLLEEMGVSSAEIRLLIKAAFGAGALGAKLTGAGGGGNIIVLPPQNNPDVVKRITHSLLSAGAEAVFSTIIAT